MIINIENISLIIPSRNSFTDLAVLLSGIPLWRTIPDEIIIVDSSTTSIELDDSFQLFCSANNIKVKIIVHKRLYPGHARNIGIKESSNQLLAFLDTSTLPTPDWLNSCLYLLRKSQASGVLGSTVYHAYNHTAKILRASTYGKNKVVTLPGSILSKDVFKTCGLFIENIRAGEDGDWMNRLDLHNIQTEQSTEYLSYNGLTDMPISSVLKKWYRNYASSVHLPFNRAHIGFYYYAFSALIVLLAFNWNQLLAAWDENSIFYIPNVTKISILSALLIYIFLRGIWLPFKKGDRLRFLIPFNFLFISALSFGLDLSKMAAFFLSRFCKGKD
ncbi:glycosyltransferase [Gammaproteobacteria bacterium]|nr:glycosyltransferase [Gammaproteobacteria bacterium]